MTTPVDNWEKRRRGYTFGEPTFYGTKHSGLDIICPRNTLLVAPLNGFVSRRYWGKQGGRWLWFEADNDYLFKFAHLEKYAKNTNDYAQEGDVLAFTGNSGLSTNPHLHLEVINPQGQRIDPEAFFKQQPYQEDDMIKIENNVTLECVAFTNLRTVPTDAEGHWQETGTLNIGNRGEVVDQTPDNLWVNINAAGIKHGWARTKYFKVVFRKPCD